MNHYAGFVKVHSTPGTITPGAFPRVSRQPEDETPPQTWYSCGIGKFILVMVYDLRKLQFFFHLLVHLCTF